MATTGSRVVSSGSVIRELNLRNDPVTVLCFDPGMELPRLEGLGEVLVVGSTPAGMAPTRTLGVPSYLLSPPSQELFAEQVIVVGVEGATLSCIAGAIRRGAKVFHFVHRPGECLSHGRAGALQVALSRSVRRGLGRLPGVSGLIERRFGYRIDPPWPTYEGSIRAVREAVAISERVPPPELAEKLRIVHYIGSLGPGGAERQLSYLAASQVEAGHDVRVWTASTLEGDRGHYRNVLEAGGVSLEEIGLAPRHGALSTQLTRRYPGDFLEAVDRHRGAEKIFPLLSRLAVRPPDVLHCWLNEQNVFGAVAGLAAGVGRVVLSTRNVSPRHLPRLDASDYRQSYQALGQASRVRILANSVAGAQDYAAWSEVDLARFRVVLNGFSLSGVSPATDQEREEGRGRLGVSTGAFLVVGVFRLDSEKRPMDFLRTLDRLHERVPRLKALHVGVGPMASAVAAEAERRGLGGVLRFLGRLEHPLEVMRVADATLLCSAYEGCPNVSLESQALAVPVVLTDGGGAAETVLPGETGFVQPVGAVEGLSDSLARLAEDTALAEDMGRRGPTWIAERFSLRRMVAETMAAYR